MTDFFDRLNRETPIRQYLSFAGVRVFESEFATNIKWVIEKHPIKKRRRNWRISCKQVPGCWQMGGDFYMHPVLFAKLSEAKI